MGRRAHGAPRQGEGIHPAPRRVEGVSVFYRAPDGAIYHTYSAYARGIDLLNTAYNYLDLVPTGRDEDELDFTQSWVQYHDRYED